MTPLHTFVYRLLTVLVAVGLWRAWQSQGSTLMVDVLWLCLLAGVALGTIAYKRELHVVERLAIDGTLSEKVVLQGKSAAAFLGFGFLCGCVVAFLMLSDTAEVFGAARKQAAMLFAVLGIGLASYRCGAEVDPRTHVAGRWWSVLGIPVGSSFQGPGEVILRRWLARANGKHGPSEIVITAVIVKARGKQWRLIGGADAGEAARVAVAMGGSHLCVETVDCSDGLVPARIASDSELLYEGPISEGSRAEPKTRRLRLWSTLALLAVPGAMGIVMFFPLGAPAPPPPELGDRAVQKVQDANMAPAADARGYKALTDAAKAAPDQQRALYEAALTSYVEALKLNPGLVSAIAGRASAYAGLGRTSEAIANAEEGWKRGDRSWGVVVTLRRAGNHEAALQALDSLLRYFRPCRLLALRGLILLDLGRTSEARAQYDELGTCHEVSDWLDELRIKSSRVRRRPR